MIKSLNNKAHTTIVAILLVVIPSVINAATCYGAYVASYEANERELANNNVRCEGAWFPETCNAEAALIHQNAEKTNLQTYFDCTD